MESEVLYENSRYYSCRYLNDFYIVFTGRFIYNYKEIRPCCALVKNMPTSVFGKTGKETVENFIEMRNALIVNAKNKSSFTPPQFIYDCDKCEHYKLDEWEESIFIKHINFSIYPSPCQCKCIYCGVSDKYDETYEVINNYNIIFDAINYAKKIDLISLDTQWQVSSGEITIHPYKDKILNLVKNNPVSILTNCFIYDEQIGEILKTNPYAAINLSIDAGTPETWYKVKGVNNFNKVIENLNKYHDNYMHDKQITLKYIIIPAINDTYDDFVSVIEIMKTLKINKIAVSRDSTFKHDNLKKLQLIESAGIFLAILSKNNKKTLLLYTSKEREAIIKYARNLLGNETEVLL